MVQITEQQWKKVVEDSLGLRNGSNANDFAGANFSMNMTELDPRKPIPRDWDSRLSKTIDQILLFANRSTDYLMIVQPSDGESWEYEGCFPKSSSHPHQKNAAVAIAQQSAAELITWVLANIPAAEAEETVAGRSTPSENAAMALITDRQWTAICLDGLGLRSGSSPTDFGAASYAMDCGVRPPHLQKPADWDDLLSGTITTIMEHGGYEQRYLMIVKPSRATGEAYRGTFPKCSSRPTTAPATILMGTQSHDELVAWVANNIPTTFSARPGGWARRLRDRLLGR